MKVNVSSKHLISKLSTFFGVEFGLLLGFLLMRMVVDTVARMFYPFLTPIASGLGLTVTAMGLVISFRSWVGLIEPLVGIAADRFGKKKLMTACLIIQAIGLIGIPFTSGWWAIAPISLIGIGMSPFVSLGQAYISDQVPYANRGRSLAFVNMSFAISGIFILPVIGWLINQNGSNGWRIPFIILGGFCLLAAGYTIWFLEEPPHQHSTPKAANIFKEFQQLIRDPAVVTVISLGFLLFYTFIVFSVVWAIWLQDKFNLDPSDIGKIARMIGYAELTAVVLSIFIIDWIGKKLNLQISFFLIILLCLTWIFFPHTLYTATLNMIVLGGVFEYAILAFFPLISDQLPNARASLFTLTGFGISIGFALGPIISLYLWELAGIQSVLSMLIGSIVLAALLVAVRLKAVY